MVSGSLQSPRSINISSFTLRSPLSLPGRLRAWQGLPLAEFNVNISYQVFDNEHLMSVRTSFCAHINSSLSDRAMLRIRRKDEYSCNAVWRDVWISRWTAWYGSIDIFGGGKSHDITDNEHLGGRLHNFGTVQLFWLWPVLRPRSSRYFFCPPPPPFLLLVSRRSLGWFSTWLSIVCPCYSLGSSYFLIQPPWNGTLYSWLVTDSAPQAFWSFVYFAFKITIKVFHGTPIYANLNVQLGIHQTRKGTFRIREDRVRFARCICLTNCSLEMKQHEI